MDSHVRTEREIMLEGELYNPADPELVELRRRARALTREINTTTEEQTELRSNLFGQLFGTLPGPFEIETPFRCDYGVHIHAGPGLYVNFGCVILDVCEVHIGAGVMMAPHVQIVTATHPIDPGLRLSGRELGKPVRIGNRVWLGAGVLVLPGVTIGDDTTIGAGSVVTRDIPPRVVAVGNPCRVLRSLD